METSHPPIPFDPQGLVALFCLSAQETDPVMEEQMVEALGEDNEGYTKRHLAKITDSLDLGVQIAQETRKRNLLTAYIDENMKEGTDFYKLTIQGRESKPSLSKSGSEKFLSLFNLQAKFRKDEETWKMLGRPNGVICYVCELYTKRGELVGEGRGTRAVEKDRDVNKAIKMAAKSAQSDAILRTGALSDYFTQDIEDVPQELLQKAPVSSYTPQGATKPAQTTKPTQSGARMASDRQIAFMQKLIEKRNLDMIDVLTNYGVESFDRLTSKQASDSLTHCSKSRCILWTNMQDKIKEILKLRAELADMENSYKKLVEPMKVKRDQLQTEILEAMRQEGEFSKRYENATISRAVRKTPKVIDEKRAVAYLKAHGADHEYVTERLTESFEAYAKEAMKQGIQIEGVQINETEYLSISEAKSEKDRRKVITD